MNTKLISESEFQDKCSEFVRREVLYPVYELIEVLFKKEMLQIDDFENLYIQSEDNPDETEPQEILEYWLVSDWLLEKLNEEKEPAAKIYGLNVWGRTTSGQAISMDHVIRELVTKCWSYKSTGEY